MSDHERGLQPPSWTMAQSATAEDRGRFILNTYIHLAGAIAIFAILEAFLLQSETAVGFAATMVGGAGGYGWLIVLGAFMGVSYIANSWAQSDASRALQYAGLGLYIVAEAIIFLPLMVIAAYQGGEGVIQTAAIVTGALVVGLTGSAFISKKDFSFLGPIIAIGGLGALGVIGAGILFGFSLGVFFAGAMVLLAGGSILYNTSKIIHDYRTDQHVAAALGLFASVALMFYYVLIILMDRR